MSVQKLNPYIHFNGNAEKAIQLYESALGAKVGNIMRHGDMPGTSVPSDKNLMMHAVLRIGEGEIMLSDTVSSAPVAVGTNMQIALHFVDEAETARAFDALAAGGRINMPLQDTFWGAKFGMLTDAYGVQWMFDCEKKKAEA